MLKIYSENIHLKILNKMKTKTKVKILAISFLAGEIMGLISLFSSFYYKPLAAGSCVIAVVSFFTALFFFVSLIRNPNVEK